MGSTQKLLEYVGYVWTAFAADNLPTLKMSGLAYNSPRLAD